MGPMELAGGAPVPPGAKCTIGACDKEHPLHCGCHIAIEMWVPGRPWWSCRYCGKASRLTRGNKIGEARIHRPGF